MIKNNKWKALLSSLLVLSPCLLGLIFWNQLPDHLTIHFGANGTSDGTGSKAFAVFGLPVIMLALHWLCLVATSLDPKQKGQNQKALGIIFWIMPMISIVVQSSFYFVSLENTDHIMLLFPFLFGILFIITGNYFPKTKQNSTMGIKLYWTLHNEENWNKTHRLAGKLYFFGGFVVLLSAFLPLAWMIGVMIAVFVVLTTVPIIYSFCLYKKHKKAGIAYGTKQSAKKRALAVILVLVLCAALFVGVGFLMFTGDITYTFYDSALRIDASFSESLTLDYEDIDEVLYYTEFNKGMRTFGFGSAKLSMGTFQNEEFGQYTLYAYNACQSAIVLRSGEKVLVITGKDILETMDLFEKLHALIQ